MELSETRCGGSGYTHLCGVREICARQYICRLVAFFLVRLFFEFARVIAGKTFIFGTFFFYQKLKLIIIGNWKDTLYCNMLKI